MELINNIDINILNFIQNNMRNGILDIIMRFITYCRKLWDYMDFNYNYFFNNKRIYGMWNTIN